MKDKIRIERHGTVGLLDIQGDVTVTSEAVLNEAYRSATNDGVRKIVLKFAGDAYINSGGIAVIIQLLASARKNNQAVSITGLSEHFKKIFNMVGITKFAKIYPSDDEALKAMAGG